MKPTRRRFLGATGLATLGGIAGCLGGGTDEGLTVQSIEVEGSPGGEVVVKPEGTVALLDFFATWCAPCKPQMAELNEIRRQFPDVHLVSITSETDEEAIREFWREYDGSWPVAMDPELEATQQYEARQTPTKLILDREGTETWRHVGLSAAESIAEKLEDAGA